jgi:hypothetical protein
VNQWQERKVGDRFVDDDGVEYEVTEIGVGDSDEPQMTICVVDGDESVAPSEPMWPWILGGAVAAVAIGVAILW